MAALVDKLRMPCLPHVRANYLYSLDICFNETFCFMHFRYISFISCTFIFWVTFSFKSCMQAGHTYLTYRCGQSVDLTVIGNPVFTLSRDLSFPYHVINRTRVITVHTFYFVACSICKFNIAYQIGQSFYFTIMIGNPSCRRFYLLLVLECVRTQVVMMSLGDIKRLLPTQKIGQMLRRMRLSKN